MQNPGGFGTADEIHRLTQRLSDALRQQQADFFDLAVDARAVAFAISNTQDLNTAGELLAETLLGFMPLGQAKLLARALRDAFQGEPGCQNR